MFVIRQSTQNPEAVDILPIAANEYRKYTINDFFFSWRTMTSYLGFKLVLRSNTEVLGLVSIEKIPSDQRIEIKLLASSRINVGPDKVFGLIVGNLIAFSCREAVKTYGINAAVSLVPKTKLKPYYIHQYGFLDGGRQLFLEGSTLLRIIAKYPA